MKEFKVDEVCKSCGGTGLYQGMAEKDGAAVVCHTCNGTGCHTFSHRYEEFIQRKEKQGIQRVYQTNPGFVIGSGKTKEGKEFSLKDFGGIPYKEWVFGLPFPKGSEMRNYSCPAWWYQGVDSDKKPKWNECIGAGAFSSCKQFENKDKCWNKWDKHYSNKKEHRNPASCDDIIMPEGWVEDSQ